MNLKTGFSFLDVFKKGQAVANPAAWKNGQITGNMLTAFLASVVGLSKVFGYEIYLTEEQLNTISTSVLALVGVLNPIATVVSTDKVGFGKVK